MGNEVNEKRKRRSVWREMKGKKRRDRGIGEGMGRENNESSEKV